MGACDFLPIWSIVSFYPFQNASWTWVTNVRFTNGLHIAGIVSSVGIRNDPGADFDGPPTLFRIAISPSSAPRGDMRVLFH